jgi:hypothetical protein
MSDEIMDWGNDMAAFIEWRKAHPLPERPSRPRPQRWSDGGRTMDRMFDLTRYERASYEAWNRLENG